MIGLTQHDVPSLPRSSHSLCVIGSKAYIFGGETQPRQPVDVTVYVWDYIVGTVSKVDGAGDVPAARVGHTASAVRGKMLVFGGRGGPAMTPLEERGAVHCFDPEQSTWTKLTPATSDYPSARSYHASTSLGDSLVIHAGCPTKGRLNDTWSFDPLTRSWTRLPDAPGDPRGGTGITQLNGALWRYGGFNGETELGKTIDVLPAGAHEWTSHEIPTKDGPGARSVAGLHALHGRIVVAFGERDPSSSGHEGAGRFWTDVWSFDPGSGSWTCVSGSELSGRGWFASDAHTNKMVGCGGLDEASQRISSGWVLSM